MAKAKMPLFSVEASGALGGLEYKRGIYGNVVGRRSISAHRSSPAQLDTRAKFGRAAHYWATLSDADRAQWNSILMSPRDLKAEVIACFLRFPWIEDYPVRPDPIASWDVGFAWISVWWPPSVPGLFELEITTDGPAQCFGNFFTLPIPYVGAYCTPEQLKYQTYASPISTTTVLPPVAYTPALRLRIDAIGRDNGVLLDTWSLDVVPDENPVTHLHQP